MAGDINSLNLLVVIGVLRVKVKECEYRHKRKRFKSGYKNDLTHSHGVFERATSFDKIQK